MFLRRVFYDDQTGEIIFDYMMESAKLNPQTIEQDKETYHCPDAACLEWTEPDAAIEQNFAEGRSANVDIATGALVFGDLPPVSDEISADEALQIIFGGDGA